MSIEQVTRIAGAPAAVFDALTSRVAHWWWHVTYETAARPDLKIEPHVGGRFVERLERSNECGGLLRR